MSQQQMNNIKPFISVALVMLFLFAFAFIKMENRRMGYSFLKLAQQEKKLRIDKREKAVKLAKMTGPERVQRLAAQRLPLKKAGTGQIIQMTTNLAIIQ